MLKLGLIVLTSICNSSITLCMKKIKIHISLRGLSVPPVDFMALDKDKYEVSIRESDAPMSDEEIIASIADKDAIYFGIDPYYSGKILKQAKNLKVMSFAGVGYENYVDTNVAKELGIEIRNILGLNAVSVAELAIGLAIDALRKITFLNGGAERLSSHELRSLNIGLIGFGNINKAIYKILKDGFGASVRYWNRTGDTTPLDTILSESDMIFIAITANEETRNFIDDDKIAKMKDGVILVNPARPDLIDENALLSALKSGKIQTIAQDGYYDNEEFKKLPSDKFIATPHIGARTKEVREATDTKSAKNIIDFFEKQDLTK